MTMTTMKKTKRNTKVCTTMTDDEVRAARVAELQRRRSVRPTADSAATVDSVIVPSANVDASTRPGVASGSKIAATGVGFTAMLGLVAAMGFAGRSSEPENFPVVSPTAPTQIVVVVHPAGGSATEAGSSGAVGAAADGPVPLTAQPTVRQAPPSQSPSGRTNGSR